MRGPGRFIEDLLGSRRPRRFRASHQDAEVIRTAITLRAARPGSGTPRPEFVSALHERLAAELQAPAPQTQVPQTQVPQRQASPRRRFLAAASLAAGAAAGGAGLDHALASGQAGPGQTEPGQTSAQGTISPDDGTWQTVLASADLPEGTVRAFDTGVVSGFAQRQGGLVRAVSGICTHQGCRLRLAAPKTRLVCPCHGASFQLDGAVLSHRLNIALAPLPRLEVREVNGSVQVYM
ncbi:MAG: Rieske (2Fe-2S) protein [Streptosporangiaceae bacterium]|nr:Rieske (2Fe-2S) protein [Streptosporangiaceae bacterium]